MTKIKDINIYNQKMRTTVIDKLFWVKEIFTPVSQLVDVGCADGTLLKTFNIISPDTELIGVDNNPDMLSVIPQNINKYSSLTELGKLKPGSVLNLSSFLHELYSYCDNNTINKFWDDVINSDAEYIVIRDMYSDNNLKEYSPEAIISYKNKILNSSFKNQLIEFEEIWGPINNIKNLTHFLLKYNYKENWNREVKENYLPWSLDDIDIKLNNKYILIYQATECLPYLKFKTGQDFGVPFDGTTHIKLIFKKK